MLRSWETATDCRTTTTVLLNIDGATDQLSQNPSYVLFSCHRLPESDAKSRNGRMYNRLYIFLQILRQSVNNKNGMGKRQRKKLRQ